MKTRAFRKADYKKFTNRNSGYVSPSLQERIRGSRLLIAGCGVGSAVAEAAVRIGFREILLVDADTIEEHNLNRQNFTFDDIGLADTG